MQIEMNGRYGTKENPTVPVRILATDLNSAWPVVVVVKESGGEIVLRYSADGKVGAIYGDSMDLVPLEVPLKTIFLVITDFQDEEEWEPFASRDAADEYAHRHGGRVLKMKEVRE